MPSSPHASSITILLSSSINPLHLFSPRRCMSPNNRDTEWHPNYTNTSKRSHNHLAILTQHHHNKIHNNIDNNNNNTVSATHTPKCLFLFPIRTEVILYATILYPALLAINTIQKFLLLEEGLWRSFPPFVLVILTCPCLLFLLIHTYH